MNLLDNRDDQSGDVYFVNFNQDCTSLAVGSNRGFKLYSFNQVNELEVIHENNSDDIRIVERLFSSSLVALVTISAPRKLKVCHFQRGSEICNYSYSNTILAVKLNRARLVVCLEESLYIHNIRDMKVLHTIRETPPNPNGLCVLSVNNDNCYLAYPGSSSIGEVQIFDALNLQAKSMIPAHDNPLAAMAFDPTGVKLATASGKGTVIRVFNVIDGTKLYEFRRGVKRCVTIFSLSFSEDSAFLSASSNTETVHIFRLEDTKDIRNENKLCSAKNPGKPSEEPQSWFDYFSKTFMQSASYLPTQVADMFNQGRSFATAHLPFSGMKNICSLAIIQKRHRVVIAADNGMLYIHDLDKTEGGDCPLINTHQVNVFDEERGNPDEQVIPVAQAEQIANRRPGQPGGTTYAAVVRGNEAGSAQERKQEKISTDAPQNESAPGSANSSLRCEIKLDDESEFPPMAYKSEV